MTALAKITTVSVRRERGGSHARRTMSKVTVSKLQLQEAIEDAQLNAIADERAAGPFVRVSLDDL
ncbi:hypothetical protein [Rubellimicrobium rubrum]|uniref:hypothetical protein n=1 Tax=Rubellimicrobium rubrum TaxID=2585369 RepID=UPI00159BA259|nr:hypothetical protein [Rubellimicrobium rubrum]